MVDDVLEDGEGSENPEGGRPLSNEPPQRKSNGFKEPDDLDAISADDIDKRLDRILLRKHALDVRKMEKESEAEAEKFRKEAKDRRAQLLKAVEASTPDLSAKLFEKMESLEHEGHEFSPQEKVALLQAQLAPLKDAQDFFDLTVAQRDDLLDRVGFYRGIVLDPSTSIDASFREVLRRPDFSATQVDNNELSPATVLYRKPLFSGYFENQFTFSEAVHQTQKSGISNLSFSLAVAGGAMTTVGVGMAASYASQEQSSAGMIGKRSYTTANFFLPRIELSFDEHKPCASQSFFEKCQAAMDKEDDTEQFKALKKVLGYYGHFVSTRTLVGGRLFATQSKVFDGKEDKSSLTERFAAKVQASLSAPTVDVQLSASAEKSTQADEKNKSSNESQSSTFHAVGGEGIVVQDAARWAESLYDYKRWAAVQRENLIPSINVLPDELSSKCWAMLKRYAKTQTKRALLFEENAWFLFYGEYGDSVGCLAKDIYFTIGNKNNDALLSLASDTELEGTAIVWKKSEDAPERSQLWRMTAEGHIVSLVTRKAGAWGARGDITFAITPEKASGTQDAVYTLIAHQLGKADNQIWESAGSGEITNVGIGKNHALLAAAENKILLKARTDNTRNDRLWQLDEIPLYFVDNLIKAANEDTAPLWFKLRLADGGPVLSINGGEGLESVLSTSQCSVVTQPDINGAHQIWQLDAKGRLISAVKAQDAGSFMDLLLSADLKTKALVVSPESPNFAQRWTLQNDQLIVSRHSELADLVIAAGNDSNNAKTGNPLAMRVSGTASKQKWTKVTVGKSLGYTSYKQIVANSQRSNEWAKMIDRRELIIAGNLTSLALKLIKRGGFWSINEGYAVQLTIGVSRENAKPAYETHNEPDDDQVLEITSDSVTGIDTQFLYLPEEPVHAIKLDVKPKSKRLCFQYKLKPDSAWTFVADDASDEPQQLSVSSTFLSNIESPDNQGLLAIGLHFDAASGVLSPKAIYRN